MPIDKRLFVNPQGGARKGGMDKDSEVHYVPNGFYTDARNVNFMVNGNRFVLTNIKGNTEKTYTLNSGSNTCIGAFDDKGNETVYFFIYNGAGDHEILKYQYNNTVDAVSNVVEGSGLNFSVDKLITGITVVNDRFLVWGQEDEEIGCIDLDNVPAASITATNRWRVELAKIEDPEPLDCFYIEDQSRSYNAISDRSFQFRYRYIYEGGFRSPFSTISKVPVPDNIFLRGNAVNKEYYDSGISIELPIPSFNKVEKIELYVRYEQDDDTKESQLWYKFREVKYEEYNNLQSSFDIVFTGSESLIPADPAEVLTETSFFPKSVKEVVFLPSNVLAFLNFVDGNDASEVVPEVQLLPQYKVRPTAKGSTTTTATYSSTSTSDVETIYNPNFNMELTTTAYETITIGGTPQVGDTIEVSLVLYYQEQSGLTNPAGISASPSTTTKTFNIVYVVKEEDTTRELVAEKLRRVINAIDTRYEGFGGIVAVSNSTAVRIYEGNNTRNSPYDVRTTINSASTTASTTVNYPAFITNVQFKLRRTKKTLKRNASHPFAIQYRDGKGRRSGAIPIGEVFVQGQDDTTNDDWVELKIAIGHTAPSWATHYDILYAKNQSYDKFLQVACNADQGIDSTTWRARVYDNLSEFYDKYGNASDTLDSYNYNYAEGDRIRLLGVIEGNGNLTKFSDQADFPIDRDDSRGVYFTVNPSTLSPSFDNGAVGPIGGLGVDFTTSGNIVRSTGNWATDGYSIGQRVLVQNASTSANNLEARIVNITTTSTTNDTLVTTAAFSADTRDTSATFTRTEKLLVEVYTPAQESTRVYYEIGVQGTVDSNGYHSGNNQNQTASQAAILDIYNTGDAYQVFIPIVPNLAFVSTNAFIECMDMSPVKNSRVTDIGRSNVELESNISIDREAAITFTQPIIQNSSNNGLSIILPTSLYNEFGSDFGSIQKAFLMQDRRLIIFFKDKVGYMGVFSELRKSANGDVSYATDSLTNQINFYAYDGGIGTNPESFAYYDTTCYFLSARNNAVCRLANDGITEISKYGMASWFNDNLDVKDNVLAGLQAHGTYDERNESYIIAISTRFNLTYVGAGGEADTFIVTPVVDGDYGEGLIQVGDSLTVTDTSSVQYQLTVLGVSYNSGNGQFTITYDAASGLANDEIFTASITSSLATLMFNEPANGWTCFMDFTPDFMETCGIDFLSWNNGSTWLHNSNDTRGSFYGTTYDAEVTVPFNIESDAQKIFLNIEQETNDPWLSETDGDVTTPAGQTSQIFDEWYEQKQPNQYAAYLGKDTSTPSAIVATDKLYEGLELRDTALTIRLTQDSTDEVKLRSVTVTSIPSTYFV